MGKRERDDGEEGRSEKSRSRADKPAKEKKQKKEKKDKEKQRRHADEADDNQQQPLIAPPAEGGSGDEAAAASGSHDADAAAPEAIQQAEAAQNGGTGAPDAAEGGAAAAGGAAAEAGGGKAAKPGKAAPVLPWMRVPIAIEASEGLLLEEVQGLDPRLKQALEGTGIEVLFPVQTVVWHETAGGSSAAHDVCICAPTGSGKTLSYALPVLQALSRRTVPQLRALAVLPTRDLAAQVFAVFSSLCPALGLTACLASGKASLAAEAALLAGGSIDVLVATPGRLIAHLEGTPGFSLAALRFLVVDETDRLLRQSYQGWLPKVMAALGGGKGAAGAAAAGALGQVGQPQQAQAQAQIEEQQEGSLQQHQAQAQEQEVGQASRRVVKFVVSATLTRDPSKINRLGLHCPRYIAMSAVDHRYRLPRSLQELKLVVAAERKPAALAALLQELAGQRTIVFTSSVEATHRLCLLLAALTCLPANSAVVEYSSLVLPAQRAAHLEAFRSGAAQVLVCSDAMTRGMDVEGVQAVVNYDAPVYVKTYVHRAGRTARAGRSGRVFTLLRHEDVRHFKDMLRKADNAFVKDHRLPKGALEAVREDVDDAVERMAAALQQEQLARGGGTTAAAPATAAAAATAASPATLAAPAGDGSQSQQQQAGGKAAKRRRVVGVPEFCLASLEC